MTLRCYLQKNKIRYNNHAKHIKEVAYYKCLWRRLCLATSPPSRIFFLCMEIYDTTSLPWEEWRDIPWYEWLYQVSNLWRVKSLYRKINGCIYQSRVILTWISRWYNQVHLSVWWSRKAFFVHRLVAAWFLWLDLYSFNFGTDWLFVCHKDDNPFNNKSENLFIWTAKDNSTDMSRKWRCKLTYNRKPKAVVQIDGTCYMQTYKSVTYASRCTWFFSWWIANSARSWRKYKWYTWKYI